MYVVPARDRCTCAETRLFVANASVTANKTQRHTSCTMYVVPARDRYSYNCTHPCVRCKRKYHSTQDVRHSYIMNDVVPHRDRSLTAVLVYHITMRSLGTEVLRHIHIPGTEYILYIMISWGARQESTCCSSSTHTFVAEVSRHTI